MKTMLKHLGTKKMLFVILLNMIIAMGFYFEHKNAGFTSLVSDVHSIVGIAQKFDNPELFKDDLFLNDLDNVRYYTPFFVQPLRWIGNYTNHDYVQALNVSSFLLHFFYGVFWFILLYQVSSRFWIAVILSLLVRGIVWLPGYEIWGITGIWSTMPRTVYATFMPLIFIFLLHFREKHLWVSALLAGLLFNFHPITGLGGILIYFSVIGFFYFRRRSHIQKPLYKILTVFLGLIVGMIPFIITYFGQTSSVIDYDVEAFHQAMNSRLPSSFFNPILFLKRWLKLNTLFFLIPILLYVLLSLKRKEEREKALLLGTITIVLLAVPNLAVYAEQGVNTLLHRNFRISFQFIRLQKLAILPGFFAMLFLLNLIRVRAYVWPFVLGLFILLLSLSNSSFFNGYPFMGNDIFRSVLPNALNISPRPSSEDPALEAMFTFIRENTPQDAVFYGPQIIRSATKRSVVLDQKGASILIESNPKQFVQWYREKTKLASLNNSEERMDFLFKKGVNFVVTNRSDFDSVIPFQRFGKYKLYQLAEISQSSGPQM